MKRILGNHLENVHSTCITETDLDDERSIIERAKKDAEAFGILFEQQEGRNSQILALPRNQKTPESRVICNVLVRIAL